MGINYHDLFFTSRVRDGVIEVMREQPVDYRSTLKTLRSKLKENGVLIITDHIAKLGSGYDAANQLHRIDPNIVKFQLNESGFDLLEEAFYLRNPNDDLNSLVFAPHIRGKTSRFVYKFVKAM
jgi:predicted methyltransferase